MAANNQANIWKFSIFRAVGNLFKPSPRTQKCIQISEEGIYRLLNLPMATGWMTDMANQLSWSVIHKLTVRIESTGDNVLFISDRSYIPLDPKSVLSKEEKTKVTDDFRKKELEILAEEKTRIATQMTQLSQQMLELRQQLAKLGSSSEEKDKTIEEIRKKLQVTEEQLNSYENMTVWQKLKKLFDKT